MGTSVTLDFQLAPKLSTFAVCSVVEWSDDGTEIVEDHRWGIDAVRRHLTEDGSVRVTLGLVPTPAFLLPLQFCWANVALFLSLSTLGSNTSLPRVGCRTSLAW